MQREQLVAEAKILLDLVARNTTTLAEAETYFQMINDVAVTEDYALMDRVTRGLNCGVERKMLVGRNEPGVQNMHRQIRDVLVL